MEEEKKEYMGKTKDEVFDKLKREWKDDCC